jgi:Ca2+-dependent lipid-binding protein
MEITLVEARGLPKMDMFGLCDPFAEISFEGQTRTTPVVNQSLAPVWETTFTLDVHKLDSLLQVSK